MRTVFCILLFIMCTTSGCRKSRNQIPNTPIDLYIDTKLPSYISLNIVGGWIYASSGYKGLIIYRRSQDAFNAYERCPYDPRMIAALLKWLKITLPEWIHAVAPNI
ncbi:MAG: hypothetical protein IPP29_19670 [Bacteroidetes bacterium]|nr:hypothetical protein [Bacteroidota bacterium]